MGWTQAICNKCWVQRHPGLEPYRMATEHTDEEICAYCGTSTRSGIYTRDDPAKVPYPSNS
jgi:hypothetical protein